MRGLVLAISVDPKGAPEPEDPANPREVRLVAHAGRGTFGEAEGYTYTIEEPGQSGEPPTSLPAVGPLLLLRKGEPVRITVVNRLRCPHAVHWHGIEVQRSWPDGVPGWSGLGNAMAPAIAPGDSFVAAFTPPRAGTFIYHSHAHEGHQIASGLFGPLIVEDPARPFDPQSERLIVIGGDGPNFPSGRVNGELEPAPVELEAARTYRLRIVHMNPDGAAVVSLLAGDQVLTWRPIAKDGADLPATQAVVGPARVLMGPGETIDVEVAFADPAELMLLTEHRRKEWRVETPIHVR
jgi:FtsP/CotA-like multicopper oxidase with cupredoxin domain